MIAGSPRGFYLKLFQSLDSLVHNKKIFLLFGYTHTQKKSTSVQKTQVANVFFMQM